MPRRDFSVRCACVMGCSVLVVGDWDDDEPGTFLDLYEHVCHQRRFRDRLRVAWAVLRGREPYTHGLVLYEEETRALRDHLTLVLESTPRQEGGADVQR